VQRYSPSLAHAAATMRIVPKLEFTLSAQTLSLVKKASYDFGPSAFDDVAGLKAGLCASRRPIFQGREFGYFNELVLVRNENKISSISSTGKNTPQSAISSSYSACCGQYNDALKITDS
jgi:hypothetical protein